MQASFENNLNELSSIEEKLVKLTEQSRLFRILFYLSDFFPYFLRLRTINYTSNESQWTFSRIYCQWLLQCVKFKMYYSVQLRSEHSIKDNNFIQIVTKQLCILEFSKSTDEVTYTHLCKTSIILMDCHLSMCIIRNWILPTGTTLVVCTVHFNILRLAATKQWTVLEQYHRNVNYFFLLFIFSPLDGRGTSVERTMYCHLHYYYKTLSFV